ncbi:MAG: response regulator transcription factor [Saprospiraceae bacterium]|nr:response regulator transcription factor [Saprospiraceae bacterium]MCB9320090.1 response regulator transcription factor [Lewinellaceae bacterium]
MNPWLKILIADDEAPARRKLQSLLKDEPLVDQVYFAEDGDIAVEKIMQLSPDLVLLDIQMPGKSGFEVIAEVGVENMPPVIFITAYDHYALRAFEVHAVDYLLKPFDRERFQTAFHQAVNQIQLKKNQTALFQQLLATFKNPQQYLDRIMVQVGTRIIPLSISDILYFESDDKYVEIHTVEQKYLLRESLSRLESQLDPKLFARVHRSHIVQIKAIRQLTPRSHGDYWIELINGKKLILSRRYRDQLFQ